MQQLSNAQKKSLAKRVSTYHDQLLSLDGVDHLDYLQRERGLTMETIVRFQLGAVIDPDGLDKGAVGRLSIPYLKPLGPRGIRFRKLPADPHPAKYWQPKGSELQLFNTGQLLKPNGWIAVTEGEMDCMTAVQIGIPCLGLPGVSSWKPHYRPIFAGFERVLIIADADDNGQGDSFAAKLAELVPGPAVFRMPDGYDLNSFYVEHGAAATRAHLKLS